MSAALEFSEMTDIMRRSLERAHRRCILLAKQNVALSDIAKELTRFCAHDDRCQFDGDDGEPCTCGLRELVERADREGL